MGTDNKLNGILALRIEFTINASLRQHIVDLKVENLCNITAVLLGNDIDSLLWKHPFLLFYFIFDQQTVW